MRTANPRHRRSMTPPGWRRPALAAAMLAALGLAGACAEADPVSTPAEEPSAAAKGDTAAAVTASSAAGSTVAVPDGKPAVVYFFAPSCYSCIAGTRAVADAQAKAPEAADYVAVNVDPGQKAEEVRAFLDAADGSALLRTTDTQGALATKFGVNALGTLIVLDADATPVYTGVDPPAGEITAAVKRAAS